MDNPKRIDIIKRSLKKTEEQISEGYSTKSWLRSLVALVPYIGGSLDILLTNKHNVIVQKRIEYLLYELKCEIEKTDSDKIDYQYLESEEWHDLFLLSLERTAKLQDRKRIAAIAKILSGAVEKDPNFEIHPVDLVQTIVDLSDQEATILYYVGTLYDSRQDLLTGSQNTLFTVEALQKIVPKELRSNVDFLLDRLVGKGLIGSIFENYGINAAAEQLLKYIDITEIAH